MTYTRVLSLCAVLLMLFIAACTPLEPKESPHMQEQIVDEKAFPEQTEPLQEPTHTKVSPLSLNMFTEDATGEQELQTEILCIPKGGQQPYTYTWNSETIALDGCTSQQCSISIKDIGVHTISCSVYDNNNEKKTADITITLTKKKVPIDSIIVFGDSLTYGYGLENPAQDNWAAQFSSTLTDANIYNYAVSGATTYSVKEYQIGQYNKDKDTLNLNEQRKLVFLWIGVNDIKNLIPLQDFKTNMREIIHDISTIRNSNAIVLTIPDVSTLGVTDNIEKGVNTFLSDIGVEGELAVKELSKDVIISYNDVLVSLANKSHIKVIDIFSFMEHIDDQLITADQFHPNEAGHKEIAEKIKDDLEILYPTETFT